MDYFIDRNGIRTKTTANGFFASYSSSFEGRIFSNGHVYCRRLSSLNFGPFSPSVYSGDFDHLGRLKMKQGKSSNLFSLAKQFEGTIKEKGKFKISLTKKDFAPDGGILVVSFIGDPFGGNSIKRKQFLRNRNKLFEIIADLKVKD